MTVTVDHTKLTPYDCLSWGAIIFSTAVADIDDDGAPDGVEDRVAGLHLDADGSELPNLPAMGGSSQHKDIYFQMDGMRTTVNKTYGDPANAPYPGVAAGQLTIPPHNHLPTPAVLKLMIQTYTNAPGVSNADGTQGVRPHFDVGNTATYHGLGPDFVSTTDTAVVDSYLVPSQYAKGGSLIDETSCGLDTSPCQFQYFPGTVGWMRGFLQFSLSPRSHLSDPARNGIFHQGFYVHARGTPRSPFPCLDASNNPTDYDSTTGTCTVANNPQFHVPRTITGVAQQPGQRFMVSTGIWDRVNEVGSPELVAGTTLHEVGHNGGPGTAVLRRYGTAKRGISSQTANLTTRAS